MRQVFSSASIAALLIVVLAQPLAADVSSTEEFSYELSDGGRISLSNVNGDIEITGSSDNTVHIVAHKKAGDEEYLEDLRIVINAHDDHVDIETRHPKSSGWSWGNKSSGSVRYEIRAPADAELDKIQTVNGDVIIKGVGGSVGVETVNGDLEVEDLAGDADLETVNGTIDAVFAQLGEGQRVKAETVNGKIVVRAPNDCSASVNAETVNGSIDADDFGLEARKGFVGRDLEGDIGDGQARLSLSTVNGSITIRER